MIKKKFIARFIFYVGFCFLLPKVSLAQSLDEFIADDFSLILLAIAIFSLAFAAWALVARSNMKQVADQQSKLNSYLQSVIAAGPMSFATLHTDGRCFCSPRLQRRLGLATQITTLKELQQFVNETGLVAKKFKTLVKRTNELVELKKSFLMSFELAGNDQTVLVAGVAAPENSAAPSESFATLWFIDVSSFSFSQNSLAQRLKSSDAQKRMLASVLNSAPYPIWIRDQNLDLEWVNIPYAQAVEIERPKYVIESQVELVGGTKSHPLRGIADRARKTNERQEERHHIVIRGERKHFIIQEVPLQEEGSATIGYAMDITNEEELRSAFDLHNKSHDETLDSLTTAVAIFNANQSLQFYNNAFVQLWELPSDYLANKPSHADLLEFMRDQNLLPEQSDFPLWKKSVLSLYTELIKPVEETWHLPSGRSLRVVTQPHPFGGLLVIYEDVTDRLALERSYNTLIAVQRETLDNLYEAVAVIGTNGRVQLHNANFEKIWNLSKTDLKGNPHIGEVLDKCKKLLDTPLQNWLELRAEILDYCTSRDQITGTWRLSNDAIIEYAVVPLPDGAVLLTLSDETAKAEIENALRERNEALETADRLKTEFVSSMSYELRTPLNTIMGFAQMLGLKYFGDLNDRQSEYIEAILSSSSKLRDLIDDILDLAMVEAGKLALDLQQFKIGEALDKVGGMVAERAKAKQLSIAINYPKKDLEIEADPRRMQQVIYNLISDSVTKSNMNGSITLSAVDSGDTVSIELHETNKFSPADNTASKIIDDTREANQLSYIGTALGLSLVKSFVEIHGGSVDIAFGVAGNRHIKCQLPKKAKTIQPFENTTDGAAH